MRLAARTVLALVTLLPGGSGLAGDDPDGVRRVEARLDGTWARFVVQVAVEHPDDGEHSGAWIGLPRQGAAIAAAVTAGGKRRALKLTLAADARVSLDALAAAPPKKHTGTGVALFASLGGVTVDVVGPGGPPLVIELTVEVPTCFLDDARYVAVPAAWVGRLAGATPADAKAGARLAEACAPGEDLLGQRWIGFPSPGLGTRAAGADRIGVEAGRFTAGDVQVARVEVALAARLGEVPADLSTVILLDASRSLSDEGFTRELATIESYARHADDTQVQVVAFAREARALLPAWTRGRDLAAGFAARHRRLPRRNGSEVDRALRLAGEFLRLQPGTRRVILLTDELSATRLAEADPESWLGGLPAGTLVHVVAVHAGGEALARVDRDGWARLAEASLGIRVVLGEHADPADLDAEHLVRPMTLDHARLRAPGFAPAAREDAPCLGAGPERVSMAEGHSCTWWGLGPSDGDEVALEGQLWGTRFSRTLPLGDWRAARIARSLPTTALGLDGSALAHAAAEAARAVNTVWSLYGRWGGEGGAQGLGARGVGAGGTCDCNGGLGRLGVGGSVGSRAGTPAGLGEQLRPALARCALDGASLALTIETNFSEIVDVQVGVRAAAGKTPTPARLAALRACAEAAAWSAAPTLRPEPLATWAINYP